MPGDSAAQSAQHLRDFADHLKTREIHPVLIFGTRAAGKSTLLGSLIHYGRQDQSARLGISLGSSVFPPNFPGGLDRHTLGTDFYHNEGKNFADRKLPGATNIQQGYPFFVPIDVSVKPSGKGREDIHRFAFLEGMGEWYEKESGPGTPATANPFKAMKSEISGLLQYFSDPISVIFVAPTVGEYATTESQKYSHECLANCMADYDSLRIDSSRDNVMLMISKWDALVPPNDPSQNFSSPSADFVVETIEHWQYVWARFSAIKGIHQGGKALTPYSAAWVNKEGAMVPSGVYRSTFDQFNRTIWNWLYGNVTEVGPGRTRKAVFADTAPPRAERGSLYSAFLRNVLQLR